MAVRINIPPFDIIIGTMCCYITSSIFDIDVNINFKDVLKLGEKIKLIEKTTVALIELKCPIVINDIRLRISIITNASVSCNG